MSINGMRGCLLDDRAICEFRLHKFLDLKGISGLVNMCWAVHSPQCRDVLVIFTGISTLRADNTLNGYISCLV